MSKHYIDPNLEVKDIHGISTSHSPTYTGNGGNRVGSTTVTLTFEISDGTFETKTETFSNIKETTSRECNYTIIYYNVVVMVTVTVEGKNSNMNIVSATAHIMDKVAIQ